MNFDGQFKFWNEQTGVVGFDVRSIGNALSVFNFQICIQIKDCVRTKVT